MPAPVRLAVRLLPLALSLAASGSAAASTAALTVLHDNNTSNSIRAPKPDFALGAEASWSTLRVIDRNWQGSLTATAAATAWKRWDGLDQQSLGLAAGLRRKFGLGAYATRLDLSVMPGQRFARTGERAAATLRLRAALGRRVHPALSLHAAVESDRTDAQRAVYSTTGHTLSLGATWDPSPVWRLAATVRTRRGDLVTWGRASWPEFAGTAPWLDGIFGGDWFPDRTDHRTDGLQLSAACALGPDTTLAGHADLSRSDRADRAHGFRHEVFSLQLVHAF